MSLFLSHAPMQTLSRMAAVLVIIKVFPVYGCSRQGKSLYWNQRNAFIDTGERERVRKRERERGRERGREREREKGREGGNLCV